MVVACSRKEKSEIASQREAFFGSLGGEAFGREPNLRPRFRDMRWRGSFLSYLGEQLARASLGFRHGFERC